MHRETLLVALSLPERDRRDVVLDMLPPEPHGVRAPKPGVHQHFQRDASCVPSGQ